MRVSVVRLEGGQVWFAPHDHQPWLCLPLGDENLEVGQVGLLVHDGGDWDFEIDSAVRVELVQLTAKGSRDTVSFGLGRDKDATDLSGHGVEPALRDKAAKLGFWRIVPRPSGSACLGHFNHEDLGQWAWEIDQEKAAEKRQKLRSAQRSRAQAQRSEAADHFVNPYTFVPFPPVPPQRRAPAYHHELGDRYSGRLTAQLVLRSPLLVRAIGSQAPRDADDVARAPRRDGALFVPGSSVHGALRSVHELLTGSCLRVFDADYVPVYRDIASTGLRQEWQLGLITEVSDIDGRPIGIEPCSERRFAWLSTLAKALPDGVPVTTGQRFVLDEKEFRDRNGRSVYDDDGPVQHDDAEGQWIVLVTDPAARAREKKGQPLQYYCAVGRLLSGTPAVAVTDRAWDGFQQAVAGAKFHFKGEEKATLREECTRLQEGAKLADVLGADLKGDTHSTKFSWISKAGTHWGRWFRPRPWLHCGQVVWIAKPRGGFTDGIALSYLWRTAGSGSAGQRLPDSGFLSCHDSDALCPSCRIFGSADLAEDRSVDRRRARQRSYRGHVRVLDAVAVEATVLDPITLPTMGSPHPGSGQFYLDDPGTEATKSPRKQWGSEADRPGLRRLRGRKVYWHTDPEIDDRRARWRQHDHRRRSGAEPPQNDKVELIAPGSRYALELRFDGLTRAEIGGLVAVLQPQRVLDALLPYDAEEPEFAIHLGGGKPLGLGSCQVQDVTVTVDNAASRYLGGPSPALDLAEAVGEFVNEHEHLREYWPAVAAALHTGHVDSRIVAYPTAQPWADDNGTCSGEQQHWSFEWFQRTTGEQLKGRERPYVQLPPVTDLPQGLRVDAGASS